MAYDAEYDPEPPVDIWVLVFLVMMVLLVIKLF